MGQHVIKHVFSWIYAGICDYLILNWVIEIVRIVVNRIFRSDVNGINFKTLKKSFSLKWKWFFQCFRSLTVSLQGNPRSLQKIGPTEIDILMIFITFLEFGGIFFEFLGSKPLLVGSQQNPGPINSGKLCDNSFNRISWIEWNYIQNRLITILSKQTRNKYMNIL